MAEGSSSTIKFGAGFDAPWFVAVGTIAAQTKQLKEAFGLEESSANTLAELIVEAGDYATALGTAATLGNNRRQQPKSIAEKAQPEDATEDVGSLVNNATTVDGLKDVYEKFKDSLTTEQLALVKAKKAELLG